MMKVAKVLVNDLVNEAMRVAKAMVVDLVDEMMKVTTAMVNGRWSRE